MIWNYEHDDPWIVRQEVQLLINSINKKILRLKSLLDFPCSQKVKEIFYQFETWSETAGKKNQLSAVHIWVKGMQCRCPIKAIQLQKVVIG